MYDEKEVKGYQKGFLSAVGISVEEVLYLPSDELWDLIYSFCNLNDVALIIEEENRLLLGSFCAFISSEQKKIVDEFYAKVLEIKSDLQKDSI